MAGQREVVALALARALSATEDVAMTEDEMRLK
jgi:hypothetical protein